MAEFAPAIAFVLGNEGTALLADPHTGEYSRYGITLSSAVSLGLCAAEDRAFIESMTAERAQQIYLDHWWTPLQLDQVANQAIATKLLDMAVNMGRRRGIYVAQLACNWLGGATLALDGAMGPHTLAAINGLDPGELLLELRAESLSFYRRLVATDPGKYAKYWESWKARAEK